MNKTALLRYIQTINLNFVKSLANKGIEATGESKENPPKVTDLLSKQAAKLQKLKNLQEKFQINDGKPVFIKKGPGDKILFQLTNVLAAIGTVMSFYTIYCMAYNVPQNDDSYTAPEEPPHIEENTEKN